jgi:hypothetical protein
MNLGQLESIATRFLALFSGLMFAVCLVAQVLERAGLIPPLGDVEVLVIAPFVLLVFPGQMLMILQLNRGIRRIGREKLTAGAQWRAVSTAFRCLPVPLRVGSLVYFYAYLPVVWMWELAKAARTENGFGPIRAAALVLGAFYLLHFLFFAFWLPNGSRIATVVTEEE